MHIGDEFMLNVIRAQRTVQAQYLQLACVAFRELLHHGPGYLQSATTISGI